MNQGSCKVWLCHEMTTFGAVSTTVTDSADNPLLVATFEGIKLGKLGSPGTVHKFTTRTSFHTQENKPQAALSCNTMPSLTPDSELELLFSPHVIPAEVQAQLGSDLHVSFCRISLCFD